ALLASGRLPWWSAPDLQMTLLRPLASALGAFDFQVLDGARHPARMHAHSLLIWMLLLCGVALVLPELLPLPAAGLALLLYSCEDAAILPVTWIANRSELIANACVVFALYCQLRGLRVASLALVALALLAGEHALPALGYLAAFELARGFRWQRLAPLCALVVSYFAGRAALGWAASGLTMYIDPIATPRRFLSAASDRLPLLFGDVVFGIASDWFPGGPPRGELFGLPLVPKAVDWPSLQLGLGWLACALVIGTLLALRGRGPVFWLLLAAALSLVPMCAATPMGRLTLPAALGVHAAFGAGLWALARRSRTAAAALGCVLLWVHGVSAGLRSHREPELYVRMARSEEQWGALAHLDVGGREVILISAGYSTHWVMPYVRHLHGLPPLTGSHTLSAAYLSEHELVRSGERSLEIRLPGRPRGGTFSGSVYRAEDRPFFAGQRIITPRFSVEILAADGGEPVWMRFTFPNSLDWDGYRFVYPFRQGVLRLTLPPIGGRLMLPPPAFPPT
ncbi:MAG TPA: hypothetical protein VJR89_05590, partial [Polyangiales bacterium]|nr:hypothetical protein [Polyangiales bacterium]